MANVEDSDLKIDTSNSQKDVAEDSTCYVGNCPHHSWEGMRRSEYSEAEADLEGHIGLFPDEPHTDSGVVRC